MSGVSARLRLVDERKDDGVWSSFAVGYEQAWAYYDDDKLKECISECYDLLDHGSTIPRYIRIATLVLLCLVVKHEADFDEARAEAQLLYDMTKSLHPDGEDEEIDDALEDLRHELNQLHAMEHTTGWPEAEDEQEQDKDEVEDDQDIEVDPEDPTDDDLTPKLTPAKPAATAPFIPVSLSSKKTLDLPLPEETKVALRPKDKQPAQEKMDVSPLNKPALVAPKKEDDDEVPLQLPGVVSREDDDDKDRLQLPGVFSREDDDDKDRLQLPVRENNPMATGSSTADYEKMYPRITLGPFRPTKEDEPQEPKDETKQQRYVAPHRRREEDVVSHRRREEELKKLKQEAKDETK